MSTDKHRSRNNLQRSERIIYCGRRNGHYKLSASICVYLWLIFCLSASVNVSGQVAPVYDRGVMGLAQMLKRLNTSASAMMIGAHPDDEDTALLTYLARGENARTAYLSLTRGDGGQNIIGPELGEALGVIRTEELLQARRLDGAEQFFTRAYDYGFSKTLVEAQSKWPEDVILCDAVKAIREFRPLVVVSQFSGTPADGHGQHQYSGWIAPRAVKAAADAAQCRNSGEPWKVQKFFVRQGFRATGEPQMRVNTGRFDPILGRSYFEIAMEARSQHKSQEQGVLELKGEMFSGLNLVDGVRGINGLFDGVDVSVIAIAGQSANSQEQFRTYMNQVFEIAKRAYSEFDPRQPSKIVPLLAAGYKAAYDAEWSTRLPNSKALMRFKQAEFSKAIKIAAGLQIDALADRETVVAGEQFPVNVRVFFPASETVSVQNIRLRTQTGWTAAEIDAPAPRQQGFFRAENPNSSKTFNVTAAADAKPTEPYWLTEPRDGELYKWPNADFVTHPFEPSVLSAEITVKIGETELKFEQPVEFRYADDTRGEIRRQLNVVPTLTLNFDKDLLIVPISEGGSKRTISVAVTNNSTTRQVAKLTVKSETESDFELNSAKGIVLEKLGSRLSIPFDFEIPPNIKTGKRQIVASAQVLTPNVSPLNLREGKVAYDHIQTHRIYSDAAASLRIIDGAIKPVKVGYIAGSGDRVAEAIREFGILVETINPAELASGDLAKYDTIVVGIRAYQVRPDLVANNKRLIDFMNAGGTLIVQYQLPAYTQQNLAPYPAQQGPRTSDENASVNIVSPEHPLMNFPNKLSATDFEGWVQERNLYNFSTMDAKYTGLLETHDAGEAENRGGLVVADVGKGKYIYCSYSLFRQLPAGVPGAYRLLANMVSLPKSK